MEHIYTVTQYQGSFWKISYTETTTYSVKLKLVAAVYTNEYSLAKLRHTRISIFSKASFWKKNCLETFLQPLLFIWSSWNLLLQFIVLNTPQQHWDILQYLFFQKPSSEKKLPRDPPPASTPYVSRLKFVCSNSYHWVLFSNTDTYLNIYLFKIHILKILALWSSHFNIHFLNSSCRKIEICWGTSLVSQNGPCTS